MRKSQRTKARPAPIRKRDNLDVEPAEPYLGYQIRRAQLAVYDDFMAGQRRTPPITPGQFTVLLLVDENPGLNQQALCRHMAVDKSTMTVSLSRLVRRGLIERVRSPEDRRQNGLRLTTAGAAALREMRTYVGQHEQRIGAQLSARERKQLIGLLRRVC
jgi:DNA-binding MarR family transcriptional regulator